MGADCKLQNDHCKFVIEDDRFPYHFKICNFQFAIIADPLPGVPEVQTGEPESLKSGPFQASCLPH